MDIELTQIDSSSCEELLRHVQAKERHVLRFEGEVVWQAVETAVQGARKQVAQMLAVPDTSIFPMRLNVAHYSIGDRCIILEIVFSQPAKFDAVVVCVTFRKDFGNPSVGRGKCLELEDPTAVIDLIAATCLPYCERSLAP